MFWQAYGTVQLICTERKLGVGSHLKLEKVFKSPCTVWREGQCQQEKLFHYSATIDSPILHLQSVHIPDFSMAMHMYHHIQKLPHILAQNFHLCFWQATPNPFNTISQGISTRAEPYPSSSELGEQIYSHTNGFIPSSYTAETQHNGGQQCLQTQGQRMHAQMMISQQGGTAKMQRVKHYLIK